MSRQSLQVGGAALLLLFLSYPPPSFAGQDASKSQLRPASDDSWSLRNWMAYSSPYADLFVVRRERDQPLGSFLMPMRLRTPEIVAGRTTRIGFYVGGDASLRWESQALDGGSRVDSHSMFSGIGGGYISGVNTPLIDKVDVGFNSLGRGIGVELTGKAVVHSSGSMSVVVMPKTLLYTVTSTVGTRELIWYANVATHWMFGRTMINVDPGMVRLPDGRTLIGGRVGVPLRKGFLAFAGVPTNLPMEYQDVLPGAHPTPGDVETGLAKGPIQIGVGAGKTVYGFFRISVKPAQVGNRNLRPQGDGHVMLSADAEASHQGHGPNAAPPRASVAVEEDLTVPPPSLLELIDDPLLRASEPRLAYDRGTASWQIGFKHTHRMMMGGQMTTMAMRVNVEVARLVELFSSPNDATVGNSAEALARVRVHLQARVREIIDEMQVLAEDKTVTPAERLRRVEPLYREGEAYRELSEELRIQYEASVRPNP